MNAIFVQKLNVMKQTEDHFEILLGFDPTNPDSDGDGVLDGYQPNSNNYLYSPKSWHF